MRQGVETIRNRVDKLAVAEPTIIRKGNDIIVELPGLKPDDFERVKKQIGRTAQLEFKMVDDGSEYMKKVAGLAVAKKAEFPGIEVGHDGWTEKDSGAAALATSTCATRTRASSSASSRRSRATTRCPSDHEIGYEQKEPQGRGGQRHLAGQALAHLLPAPPRRAHRRVHHRRRGQLGSADRPSRGLAAPSTTKAPTCSRRPSARQHRPQDGHHPRREDQLGAGHRRHASAAATRASRMGGYSRSVPAAAGGQGPGRRPAHGRAAGAAQEDLRDAGRPDARARTPSTRPSSR